MPANNPTAVNIWANAGVYFDPTGTALKPATIADPLPRAWANGGILDGDAGFSNERKWDESTHFGWGIGLYRKGYKNYEESRKLTLLENNRITRKIAHPGSSATGIRVPRPALMGVCFETINDFGRKERYFTAVPASLWIPNLDRNESDPSGMECTATIYAQGDGLLYVRQYTPVNETQTVTVVGATSGTFALGFEDQVTGAIPYNAPTTAVQAALEAILGTGQVTVTGTVGAYVINLVGEFLGETNQLITADTALLLPAPAARVTVVGS